MTIEQADEIIRLLKGIYVLLVMLPIWLGIMVFLGGWGKR